MPKGTPLTPAELAELAELYGEVGNATEVARQLNVDPSTVTRNLARLGEQRRAILQGRALAAGLIRGGDFLIRLQEKLGQALCGELESGEGMRPQEYEAAIGALVKVNAGVAALDVREERRRQARLTRAKTRGDIAKVSADTAKVRAETRALEREGDPTVEQLAAAIGALSREDKVRLRDALQRAPEPKPGEGT